MKKRFFLLSSMFFFLLPAIAPAGVGQNSMIYCPDGFKRIQNLIISDRIWALEKGTNLQTNRISRRIHQKNSPINPQGALLIYLQLKDNSGFEYIYLTLDQPVLLYNGKIFRAEMLRKGDKLLNRNGKPVEIREKRTDSYLTGYTEIFTRNRYSGIPLKHFFSANNIMVGDGWLQRNFYTLHPEIRERASVQKKEEKLNIDADYMIRFNHFRTPGHH